jgi:hypothetical protein
MKGQLDVLSAMAGHRRQFLNVPFYEPVSSIISTKDDSYLTHKTFDLSG